MWLESQHQAPARKGAARCSQGGGHLNRVVTVIVNQGEAAARCCCHLTVALEPAAHPLEVGQGPLHCGIRQVELDRHRNRRQGIEHVVPPWQLELHCQVRQGHAVAPLHRELHVPAQRPYLGGAHLGALLKAIAGDRAGHLRHDGAHGSIVGAQNCGAIKGHAVQKINKGLLQAAKVMAVGLHVIGVDIGHHRHDRQQVEEGCVRFVGLHHDVVALPQARIGTRAVEPSTNYKSRVESGLGEHARHQAGGGGLAMGAGNGNALFEAHQLGEHQGAWHHWNAAHPGRQDLGVVRLNRGGGHHAIRARHMAGSMA